MFSFHRVSYLKWPKTWSLIAIGLCTSNFKQVLCSCNKQEKEINAKTHLVKKIVLIFRDLFSVFVKFFEIFGIIKMFKLLSLPQSLIKKLPTFDNLLATFNLEGITGLKEICEGLDI